MIKQYRKKPVQIEAVEWDSSELAWAIIAQWAKGTHCRVDPLDENDNQRRLYIDTLEGEMTANHGDYIIKGVKGELYPCKPDIFAATYEEVAV